MSEFQMDVFLLNTPQPGVDQKVLSRKLAALFKKDVATIDKMLGQPRTRIKKDVDQALANKYKSIIESAGGQCELVILELPLATASEESSPDLPPTAQMIDETTQCCAQCGASKQLGACNCSESPAPQMQTTAKNTFANSPLARWVGGFAIYRFHLGALVVLVGILIAVAVPAYKDYTVEAKVKSAMPLVNNARDQITKYIKSTNSLPTGNSEAGLPEAISSEVIASMILQEDAKLEVTFNLPSLRNKGNTIIWIPTYEGDKITWSCTGGTLPDAYRMRECRGGGATESSSNTEDKHINRLSQRMFSDDQRVSINLPEEWRAHAKLSEDASISAAHVNGAIYALVIQESKPGFDKSVTLSEYTQSIVSLMKENMSDGRAPGNPRKLKVKGLPAEQLVLTGTVENIKVAYVLTTIESEQGFYQVLAWTLASRLKDQHPLLRSIGKSFVIHQDSN